MTCKRYESFLKIYVPNHIVKSLDDKDTFYGGIKLPTTHMAGFPEDYTQIHEAK